MERFWNKVGPATSSGCMLWTGAVNRGGYGVVRFRGRTQSAHRVAMELVTGEAPTGYVLHKCDIRRCVNPEHLYAGTAANNTRDMLDRGRCRPGRVPGAKHGQSKLNDEDVREIRNRYSSGDVTQGALAAEYGVGQDVISRIANRLAWAHVSPK